MLLQQRSETVSAECMITQFSEFQAVGPATVKAQQPYVLSLSRHNQVITTGRTHMPLNNNIRDRNAAVHQVLVGFVMQTVMHHWQNLYLIHSGTKPLAYFFRTSGFVALGSLMFLYGTKALPDTQSTSNTERECHVILVRKNYYTKQAIWEFTRLT